MAEEQTIRQQDLDRVKAEAYDQVTELQKHAARLLSENQQLQACLNQVIAKLELEGDITTETILETLDRKLKKPRKAK